MQEKFLKVGSLALLQIVIVGNLQPLPANAVYGFTLPFLYLVAILGFFLPCALMVAELATTRPQTGGAYIWCESAFGSRMGFVTVSLLWISNLLWYPSLFSFIAANAAYLFDPSLAQNKWFVVGFGMMLFWIFTGFNCVGIKFSSVISVVGSVVGVILPMLLIIMGGVYWWGSSKTLAISLHLSAFLPDVSHFSNVGLLIAIVISLFGIELTAVHAGNVQNPKRDYPRSLLISCIVLIVLLVLSEMAIAVLIPPSALSVLTGLLDALTTIAKGLHLMQWLVPVLFLVLLGNIGSVCAWMLASTRGMYVACQKNQITHFLQSVNRHEAPVGVLLFEAMIFTLASLVFLVFPRVTDSFWLLMDLASQVTLIYYIILFASAVRLRSKPAMAQGFVIPGGRLTLWLLMGLGALTSLVALCAGFVAPDTLDPHGARVFHIMMGVGLVTTLLLPLVLLWFKVDLPTSEFVH